MQNYITTTEAARRINVHPTTVQSYVRKGLLPAIRVARDLVINPDDLAKIVFPLERAPRGVKHSKARKAKRKAAKK